MWEKLKKFGEILSFFGDSISLIASWKFWGHPMIVYILAFLTISGSIFLFLRKSITVSCENTPEFITKHPHIPHEMNLEIVTDLKIKITNNSRKTTNILNVSVKNIKSRLSQSVLSEESLIKTNLKLPPNGKVFVDFAKFCNPAPKDDVSNVLLHMTNQEWPKESSLMINGERYPISDAPYTIFLKVYSENMFEEISIFFETNNGNPVINKI